MDKEILDQLRSSLPKHYVKLLRKNLRGAKKKVSAQYISTVMNGRKHDLAILQAAIQLKSDLESEKSTMQRSIVGEGAE